MKNFEIKNITQLNEFADSSLANNGGGYSQPRVEFTLNDKPGVFEDTSCGEFGTRCRLEFDDKVDVWGSMLDESEHRDEISQQDVRIIMNKIEKLISKTDDEVLELAD